MIYDIRPLLNNFLSLEAAILNPAKATPLALFGLPLIVTGLLLKLHLISAKHNNSALNIWKAPAATTWLFVTCKKQ